MDVTDSDIAIIHGIASSYARRKGGDVDDLMQEGLLAALEAPYCADAPGPEEWGAAGRIAKLRIDVAADRRRARFHNHYEVRESDVHEEVDLAVVVDVRKAVATLTEMELVLIRRSGEELRETTAADLGITRGRLIYLLEQARAKAKKSLGEAYDYLLNTPVLRVRRNGLPYDPQSRNAKYQRRQRQRQCDDKDVA